MKIKPLVHTRNNRTNSAQAALGELQAIWRALWRQHVEWVRMTAQSIAAGQADLFAAGEGLLRNAQDMAAALERPYGSGLAAGFACLLRGHIWIMLRMMEATRTGDAAALAALEQERCANTGDLAAYLAAINPNLPQVTIADLLRQHQQLTAGMVAAISCGDAAAASQAYEMSLTQSALLADTMAAAIARQFMQ